MMAERLAEIRRDLDSEAYTSYLPKTVRELLDHIDGLKFANGVLDDAAKDAQAWSVRAQTAEAKCAQLEAHKAEYMQVFASLQIQEIAKEIGAPLGSGVPEQILPWIKSAKVQLEAQADESSATMERLSGVVERYRGGMQPSSAERCALRWSHSSATDRGSFDRGWEAREAEGLEARSEGEQGTTGERNDNGRGELCLI